MLIIGACFGAGLDIISAADMRYCSADAYFCVKEVDLAIAADMGVLQRLPGIIGQGRTCLATSYKAVLTYTATLSGTCPATGNLRVIMRLAQLEASQFHPLGIEPLVLADSSKPAP